jgi:hypothetical protein
MISRDGFGCTRPVSGAIADGGTGFFRKPEARARRVKTAVVQSLVPEKIDKEAS